LIIRLNFLRDKFRIFWYRGKTQDRLGNSEKAVEDYTASLNLYPKNADAYYDRSLANYDLKKFDQSLNDINSAMQLSPNDADFYLQRGNINLALEKYAESLADYEQTIKLAPKYENDLKSKIDNLKIVVEQKKNATDKNQ
jgi:Tetratricopeptide repeat.